MKAILIPAIDIPTLEEPMVLQGKNYVLVTGIPQKSQSGICSTALRIDGEKEEDVVEIFTVITTVMKPWAKKLVHNNSRILLELIANRLESL